LRTDGSIAGASERCRIPSAICTETAVAAFASAFPRAAFVPVPANLLPEIEPGLPRALRRLSERQRVVIVMVHAYGWSRRDAAEVLEVSLSTIDSHLERGLSKLRRLMGAESHA